VHDDPGVRIAPRSRLSSALLLSCISACAGGDDGSGDTATGSTGMATGSEGSMSSAPDDGDDDAPATDTSAPTTDDPVTSTAPGTDTGTDDDTTTGSAGDPGDYLLTIDSDASPPALVRIDLAAVGTEVLCELPGNAAYDSLVFSRDGVLFGNNQAQGRLETINPCNCGFQLVGSTSATSLVLTIAADDGLFAIDPVLDALVEVDPDTGLANPIGGLAIDFAAAGAAWSDDLTGIYAVEAGTDLLYAIDERTGVAASTVGLDLDVTAPGLAVHPDGTFWLCSGSTLLELDPLTGVATEAGELELTGACTNLTAPQTAIACLD
jgi:hypothetical protein